MAVSISLEDLESTIAMVDTVLQHLKNQGKASKQDIAQLKEIIFHLDGLLVRLKAEPDGQNDLLTQDVIRFLSSALENMRDVLESEEDTEHEHQKEGHQESNDNLFASLVKQIQQL